MATGQELALQLLPFFAENVVARHSPRSYGYYAKLIGRDPAKEAISIGPAMHAIGAVCVIQQLPVAPLHWVIRAKGEPRQVFASDVLESHHILERGRFDTMYVVAREYRYSIAEFERLQQAMEKLINKAPPDWTPHFLWHLAIIKKSKGEDQTFLERAMSRYELLQAQFKEERTRAKG
jgi:hypothetical protein